jgi:hypothetical protein
MSGYHGHVNWTTATYEGQLTWHEKSAQGKDDDYTIGISRPDRALETQYNGGEVGVEFDSDETVDHFGSIWWNQLKSAVNGDFNDPHVILDGHRGIVTGLVGLDAAHSIATELHPAFAVIVNSQHDPPQQDEWSFFVRNWGNEGYCSNDYHWLEIRTYEFLIPWQPGASGFRVEPDSLAYPQGASVLPLVGIPGKGVLVKVNLDDPSHWPLIDGLIHLLWLDANGVPLQSLLPPTTIDCKTAQTDIQALENQSAALSDGLQDLSGPEKSGVLANIASLNRRISEIIRQCGRQTIRIPIRPNPNAELEDGDATMSVLSPAQRGVFARHYDNSKISENLIGIADASSADPILVARGASPAAVTSAATVTMMKVPGFGGIARIRDAYCVATGNASPEFARCP